MKFWHGTSFSGSSSSSKSAGTKQPGKQQIDLDRFVKPSGYVEFLKFPRDILLMEEIPKQPPAIYETLWKMGYSPYQLLIAGFLNHQQQWVPPIIRQIQIIQSTCPQNSTIHRNALNKHSLHPTAYPNPKRKTAPAGLRLRIFGPVTSRILQGIWNKPIGFAI